MIKQWWKQVTESPYPYVLSHQSSGKLMSILFIAAGVMTWVSTRLPLPTGARTGQLEWVGILTLVCGLVAWWLPWSMIPRWVTLGFAVPIANFLIMAQNFTLDDPYRYALYFLICFIWLGLTQRQGMGIALLPITVFAYLFPIVTLHRGPVAVASAVFMLPLLALIAEALAWFGHRLGSAQVRLLHMAYHDSLTGLYNRSHFYQVMDDVAKPSGSSNGPALVMLVDLNGFKAVNDAYGHATGDELLRATAQVLEASTHGHGIWARLGGDEFGCIVPGLAGIDAADRFAHMVRQALDVPIQVESGVFQVEASLGCAVLSAPGGTPKDVMSRADAAVYLDKAAPHALNTRAIRLA